MHLALDLITAAGTLILIVLGCANFRIATLYAQGGIGGGIQMGWDRVVVG